MRVDGQSAPAGADDEKDDRDKARSYACALPPEPRQISTSFRHSNLLSDAVKSAHSSAALYDHIGVHHQVVLLIVPLIDKPSSKLRYTALLMTT
jgi:hypothetical protein